MIGSRTLRAAYAAVIAALLTVALFHFLRWGVAAVVFPYGIDYGEGIVWQQMVDIVHGRGYAPVTGFPSIVFHYPPVYHLVAAAAGLFTPTPLFGGRLVSLLATIGTLVLIAVIVAEQAGPRDTSRAARWLGGAVGGVAFVSMSAVCYWAPLMRVDPVGGLLQVAGLSLALAALRRPNAIFPATTCFVLSIFTKQTEVAAPIACFAVLLLVRPFTALKGIVLGLLLGGAIGGGLMLATQGRFLTHVFTYNINSFRAADILPQLRHGMIKPDRLPTALGWLVAATIFIGWAVAGRHRPAELWRSLAADRRVTVQVVLLIFLALKTASLTALGKGGAGNNYLVEWYVPVCIYLGIGAAWLIGIIEGRAERRQAAIPTILLATLPVLVAGWLAFAKGTRILPDLTRTGASLAAVEQVLAPVRGQVLSEEMVLLMRTGRGVPWEPAIFRELARTGQYDQFPVIRAIEERRITAVVTDVVPDPSNYSPAVLAAVRRNLPVEERIDHWVVHLPARDRR